MIDYNKASSTYDNSRNAHENILHEFSLKVNLKTAKILDFGCGTGNYLKLISNAYGNKGSGVEPSDGMREKAAEKNPDLEIKKGDHSHLPFKDALFDFIYMTDVIHHVPDMVMMFSEMKRVLKPEGYICIETQSWEQIEARWYNRYFDSLIDNEKKRYPDIPVIIDKAIKAGLKIDEVKTLLADPKKTVTEAFIQNVKERNFSMFRMISDQEIEKGIKGLQKDLGKVIMAEKSGDTLVWIKK